MEQKGSGERKAEEKKAPPVNRRAMLLWVLAVLLVIVAYSGIEIHEQWRMYDAGRLRERKEIARRIEARIEAGKRAFDEDLGVWLIPDGPKHIKIKSRQQIAAAKGE